MKRLMPPARKAEAVRRGLAAFFIAAGALALYATTSVLSPAIGLMLGIPPIVLGVGIWRYWGLARWAALGSCFLLVVCAFALPLVMTGVLTYIETDNPARLEWFGWCVAGAIGMLGFWGLQYFRSPAARAAFARSADIRAAFERESPAVVVTSSLVVLVTWVMPIALVWSGESKSVGGAHESTRPNTYPDLVFGGLCLGGNSMVNAIITNRGNRDSEERFVISYSSLRVGGVAGGTSIARVPPAGSQGLVGLDRAINPYTTASEGLDVRVSLDTSDTVPESDEANNQATFPIVFSNHLPGNLSRCPQLPEINGR